MRYKRFGNKFVVRLDRGEEIVETLKRFCRENNVKLGFIIGVGAVDEAVVGFFDVKSKEYHKKVLTEGFEVAPLYGIISTMDGEVYLHVHVNLCDSDHKSFGGHLNSAVVSATFEAIVDVIDGDVGRVFNENLGLNILDI
ncbi:MAG TPA: DNA-binding protein [Thermoplasmatales archaeon]|nr:DNA-binding protein [Thermoplasmatales archaeon]